MQKLLLYLNCLIVFINVNGQVSNSVNHEQSIAESTNKKFEIQPKKLYLPVALLVIGIAVDSNSDSSFKNQIKDWRNQEIPNFRTHIDDYLQFAPLAATYGFEIAGMKPKTDWRNRTAIMVKSQIMTLGSVYILKKSFNTVRPDGSALSFPSGHTAEAFAGATLLSIEYGENYKWVPYVAYGTAATVGALRIANNRHYISDVLFGAGLGILSTKIAYWTHQYQWNKKSEKDPLTVLYKESL